MIEDNMRISKSDIENIIRGKDDFVKIDYLRRFLSKADNLEIKKFILINLANLSEARGLVKESVKYISAAGDIAITYREKMEFFMKEAELYIRLKEFDQAEKAWKKASFYGNSNEKMELSKKYKELYWNVAESEERAGKSRNSIKIYEKALNVNDLKKKEIMEKLVDLYEKTAMIKEANQMKERLGKI